MKKPYRLWKRGKVYYYRLEKMTGWKSTGKGSERAAERFIIEQMKRPPARAHFVSFREYSRPFFLWGSCPHQLRLTGLKQTISPEYCKTQRSYLERFILKDPVADIALGEIRKGDLIDFRGRMLARDFSDRKVNSIVGTLRIIIKEAFQREDIDRDPSAGLGEIKETPRERGTFSKRELRELFPRDGLGPWQTLQDYTAFLLAATVGMRRGEILALRWRNVSLEARAVAIEEAVKSRDRLGLPKWEKPRNAPLPEITAEALGNLREDSIYIGPDDFVFTDQIGRRLSYECWNRAFKAAMEKAGIDTERRNLVPHSFRHSLNTELRAMEYGDKLLQEAFGWSGEKVQNTYTHFQVEHMRRQAELTDKLFE